MFSCMHGSTFASDYLSKRHCLSPNEFILTVFIKYQELKDHYYLC